MRPRLTYANVMSSIAVFLAMGGVTYAAATLPRNSVGSRQLRTGAVTSAKVKDRTLLAADFKAGQLPQGARGAQGVPGPQGAPGATGPQGPAGPKGADAPLTGVVRGTAVYGATANVPAPPGSADLLTVPGLGVVKVACVGRGTNDVGLTVRVQNDTGADVYYVYRTSDEAGAAVSVSSLGMPAGGSALVTFSASSISLAGRLLEFHTMTGPAVTITLAAQTKTAGSLCSVRARAVVAP